VTPDPITAALDQVTACRAAVTALDAREAAHHGDLTAQVTQLAGLVDAVSRALAEDTAALARLDDLDRRVTALTRRPAQPNRQEDPGRWHPAAAASPPGPGDPSGASLADPVERLRDWAERVYRPGYGHLAVLGPCWPRHPLCLYGLDILSQLWTALYADPDPDAGTSLLTAQAEYQARILPAIAAQLAAETTRCGHPTVRAYPGARP
jgi:hypothetical protein